LHSRPKVLDILACIYMSIKDGAQVM